MFRTPSRWKRGVIIIIMKSEIHPDYHPVIFQDMTTGKRYFTRSTAKSDKTENVDGVDYFVISAGVIVDTEGRIDKFQKRFGSVRRAKKPSLG